MEPQMWNILKWQAIMVMAKEHLHNGNQLLLFLLLRKQGKPVIYNGVIYCTYIL